MKFIDEYRQSDLARILANKIASLTGQPLKLMEVCGGHTYTIFKYGIEDLLPHLHDVRRRDARARIEDQPAGCKSCRR